MMKDFNDKLIESINQTYDCPIDLIVSADDNCFLSASIMAKELSAGLIPLKKLKRKKNIKDMTEKYLKDYSKEEYLMRKGTIAQHEKVIIIDNLEKNSDYGSAINLIEKLGGDIVAYVQINESNGTIKHQITAQVQVLTD